jgi:hypothetical protein
MPFRAINLFSYLAHLGQVKRFDSRKQAQFRFKKQ